MTGGVPLASSDGDSLLALVVGSFLGLYLIYDGFGKWQTKRVIEDTPTAKVRSMAVGRTELEGIAEPDGGTIEAPFTDEECLHIDWEVEEWRKDPDDDDYDWATVAKGARSVPFYLDDGTGQVLVRADQGNPAFEVSPANTRQFTVDSGHSPPAEVREFIEHHDSRYDDTGFFEDPVDALTDLATSGGIGFTDRRRRYTQRVLPAGSDVYLLGSAVQRDAGGTMEGQEDLLAVTREEELDTFVISGRSEEELESYYERRGPLETVGGLALSAVCLALLLTWF